MYRAPANFKRKTMSHILFIDTETTGLDPKRHGIISLCARLYKDGKPVEGRDSDLDEHGNVGAALVCDYHWYRFNEDFDTYQIDLSAMRVNKLALDRDGLRYQIHYQGRSGCRELHPDEKLLMNEKSFANSFASFLIQINKIPDLCVGGMNVQFDLRFIQALFEKHNLNPQGVIPTRVVDTQVIAAFLHNAGIINVPNFKSETLYKHFDIEMQGIHCALVDVNRTSELYYKMQDKMKKLQKTASDSLPASYRV